MRWCERFGLGFATCFWAELCSPTRMQQADCGREVVERTADVVRGFKKSCSCLAGLGHAAPCLGAFRRRQASCRSDGASPGAAGATAVVIRVVIVTALVLENIVQRLGKVCLGH